MASSNSVLRGGWGWVDGVGLVIVFVLPAWVWWLGLCCRCGCDWVCVAGVGVVGEWEKKIIIF